MCLTLSIRGSSELKVGMVTLKLYVSRPERPKPLPCPTPMGWEQRLAREPLGMALEGHLVSMDCVTLLFLSFPGHSPSAHLWPRSSGRITEIMGVVSAWLGAQLLVYTMQPQAQLQDTCPPVGFSLAPDPLLGIQQLPAARLIFKI